MSCSAKTIGERAAKSIPDRFWPKVIRRGDDECWGWNGARHVFGYGILGAGRKRAPLGAHRVSWELHNGPIPDGLHVLHKCDNPPCCNPRHLFIGTVKDNSVDCARKGRVRGGMPKGKNRGALNAQARLTDEAVLDIRNAYAGGGVTYFDLAAKHGVTFAAIGQIVRGENWEHVGGPRGGRRAA